MPTTAERCSASVTNGVAKSDFSAQPYSFAADESALRPVAQARPPAGQHQSSCSAIITSVAMAGVLYVWSSREL